MARREIRDLSKARCAALPDGGADDLRYAYCYVFHARCRVDRSLPGIVPMAARRMDLSEKTMQLIRCSRPRPTLKMSERRNVIDKKKRPQEGRT